MNQPTHGKKTTDSIEKGKANDGIKLNSKNKASSITDMIKYFLFVFFFYFIDTHIH